MKHLTAQQLEALDRAMSQRTKTLAAEVREALAASDVQHFRDLAGTVTDTADESLARVLVDVGAAMIHRDVIELRDIEAARDRLGRGEYGLCVNCGDAVPYERLAAYPSAKRCVRCQRQREHDYQHPATPTL